MKRTPLKRGNYRLKRAKAQKALTEKKHMTLMLSTFFRQFYFSQPPGNRKCWSCGSPLANEPRSYYFDHLIEKSKRPDLAFETENIFLCCLECHSLKTDGHPTEKHQEAIEKAKERFGIS